MTPFFYVFYFPVVSLIDNIVFNWFSMIRSFYLLLARLDIYDIALWTMWYAHTEVVWLCIIFRKTWLVEKDVMTFPTSFSRHHWWRYRSLFFCHDRCRTYWNVSKGLIENMVKQPVEVEFHKLWTRIIKFQYYNKPDIQLSLYVLLWSKSFNRGYQGSKATYNFHIRLLNACSTTLWRPYH